MTSPGRDWDNPEAMLGVDEALSRILSVFSPLPSIKVPLLESVGLVLADDVVAPTNVPPFTNSAMDGFAVRSSDCRAHDTPLSVTVTISAGTAQLPELQPGQAARIMTGAPLPPGADAVVRFEETSLSESETGRTVLISRPVASGENVRQSGEDVAAGSIALNAGKRVQPAAIGVLATLNLQVVSVHRRPRVGVLSTGDEVVGLGAPLAPGQIRDANSYMISAAVLRLGAVPVELGIARDDTEVLRRTLTDTRELDLIISSGGVSVGDYDIVKNVMQAEGEMDIWQVRMKPGKPLAFGHVGGTPLLGLPGNPVAALVSFDQFARPAILKMLGRDQVHLPCVRATLETAVENRGGRRHFVRGTLVGEEHDPVFKPSGESGSAMLRAAAESTCYMVVPEDRTSLDAGERVTVQLPDKGL